MKAVEFGTLFEFIRNGMNVRQDKSGEGLPITRIETISEAVVDGTRVGYAGLRENDCDGWLLQYGDILFSHINSVEHIGKCAVYEGAPEKLVHGMNLLCLRPDKAKLVPQFAKYLIRSMVFRSRLSNFINKAVNQASVSIGNLKTIPVEVPTLDEQRRIAAILDKADAIRRKRQESIRLTEEFLRSTFLEMFGDPETNPKGWPEIRLEDIADIQSGITKGRKLNGQETMNVPYMRVANVQDGHIALGEIKEIEATPVEIERYRLLSGDILLTEGGDPDKLGRGAVWQGEITPCIHQNHIFRVRPNADKVLPDYLSALIGSVRGKQYFLGAAKQTTGIASINKTQLSNFPALLPPIALQRQFTETVRKIEAVQVKLSTISELQGTCINSLTHRAFRGEL